MTLDTPGQVKRFQGLLTLPRETLPAFTARETRKTLEETARRSDLEVIDNKASTPTFLLLPRSAPARVVLFGTWHAEPPSGFSRRIEGSERLALVACLGALEELQTSGGISSGVALVVAPSSANGSHLLGELLREQRERLQPEAAYWVQVGSVARRRRVFLGARGTVVLALWSGDANPYQLRDRVVAEMEETAFGPRPLDFELTRKLASSPEALAFASGAEGASIPPHADAEKSLRKALFGVSGSVSAPSGAHPSRPKAWITIEGGEGMEAGLVADRARELSAGGQVEVAEDFPWDRLNIHQRAAQTLIALAKRRSEGAEIWPLAPWSTPSGIMTRTVGVGMAEWNLDLPEGTRIRFPTGDQLRLLSAELLEGLRLGDVPGTTRTPSEQEDQGRAK